MKQEATKKSKKWLLPVIIAAAVLVVVGIVLAIFLGPWGQSGSGAVQSDLYWNVDRLANVEEDTGMSIREKGADGLYTIRFALNGEQVELKAADKKVVNAIDFMDLMGLVFDADGLIVGVLDPAEVATEVAKDFFVKDVNGSVLAINSSQAMNGMAMNIDITETVGIYNVTTYAEVVGQRETEFQTMDRVSVYANADGEVTHIFITQRFMEAGIYYRLDRVYDTTTGKTLREPDENGVYTIPFAHEGEQVELKCKDKDLVSSIEAGTGAKQAMGLRFDEEGYIIGKVTVAEALRGKLLYSYWNVTAIEGTTVTIEAKWASNKQLGSVETFEMSESCDDIFLLETNCEAEFVGQRMDSLKVGDMIFLYTDFYNNPVLVYIVNRCCDYPIYYNVSRKSLDDNGVTTRKPDENGYYVFEMVSEGKEVTVRTKDQTLASKVDKYAACIVGMKVENGIIKDVVSGQCITGRTSIGTGRYVTEVLGTIVRIVSAADFTSGSNFVLSPDCKIYDVSGAYGVPLGTETTLRVGDRIQAQRTPGNEVAVAFVYQRYEEDSEIYFNHTRYYDSTLQTTKREPDENGYYVFNMEGGGKSVELKTKDKALATYIDKQSSKFVALKVSNGIIKGAYSAISAVKYGATTMKGAYYRGLDEDGNFLYYSLSSGEQVNKVGKKKASDCIVYNVSTVFVNNRGEKTKLQKDDYYWAFMSRETQEVVQVYVRSRQAEGPLYWPVDPQFNDSTGETSRVPDADGYYWIEVFAEGKLLKLKTKDKALASRVDDYNYAFGLYLNGDEILNVYSATTVRNIDGYAYRNTYVRAIDGDKVILCDTNPSSENYGKDLELIFTSESKIYDVCSSSATYGQATELKVGDKICSYQDADGKVVYCFIKSRGAVFSECEACYKQAIAAGKTEAEAKAISLKAWSEFSGGNADKNEHYYLNQDFLNYDKGSRFMIYSLTGTVCLDLNGHKVTMAKTYATTDGEEMTSAAFRAYSNGVINLMDSKGTAVVEGYGYSTGGSNSGCAVEVRGTGILNIYGGTYKRAADAKAKVAIGCHTAYDGQINIYGGTIESLYVREGGTLTLAGAPKIAELTIADGAVANIDGLKPQAEIAVKGGDGKVLTAPSANAAAVKDCFVSIAGATVEINSKNELVLSVNVPDFSANAFTTDFDPAANAGYGYCEACYKQAIAAGKTEQEAQEASLKQWTVFTGGEPTKGEHYYLAEDFENYNATTRFIDQKASGTYCVNLNGKTVTMSTESTEALCRVTTGGVLNIMDAKGTGVLAGYEFGTGGTNSGTAVEIRNNGIVNIYGGDFRRVEGSSANVAVGCHSTVSGQINIYGGTFDGVYVRSGAAIKLAGAPQITNLSTASDVVANIDELQTTAQISVKGSEGKVFTAPSANAAAVKDCFTAVTEGLGVDVNNDQLVIISLGTEPGTPDTPDTPDVPDVNEEIFTTGFDPANNDGYAYCEACYKQALAAGKTEQEAQAASLQKWTSFTGGNAASNKHYYLTQSYDNYNANSRFMALANDEAVCWNLNGYSVTMAADTTNALVRVYGSDSVLNIMDAKGTGFLAGYEDQNADAGAVIELREGNPTCNIYGGIFRLAEGASEKPVIGVYNATAPNLNIYGGTVAGINAASGLNLKLAGAPQITGLALADGVVANIDELAATAQIAVAGDLGKVISNVSTNAAAVKDCFTAAEGLDVEVDANGALAIVTAEPNPAQFVKDWHEAQVAAGTFANKANGDTVTASCPFCNEEVTWTGVAPSTSGSYTMGGSSSAVTAGCHVFLTEGTTAARANVFSAGGGCVYLNGMDLSSSGKDNRLRIKEGVNVIAYDSEISTTKATRSMPILQLEGAGSVYGGTYVNNGGAEFPLIGKYNDFAVNLYDCVLVNAVSNVVVVGDVYQNGCAVFGALNLYNCTLTGDASVATVNLAGGSLTINNGVVSGGVNVAEGAELILVGRPVLNKLENGTGVTLNGAAVINVDGLKLGAQVAIEGVADQVISNVSENVAVAQKCFVANEGLEVSVTTDGALVLAQAAQPVQLALEEQDESSETVKK